jgi:enoyl-CoA hydratase
MGVEDDIRRDDADGIVTLTFTRDRKLNAVTNEMLDIIREAVRDLGDREDLRAMIVQAEGRYFTAGADIGEMVAQPESGVALRRDYRRLHDLFDEVEHIEKPIVLAAQGPCLGFGVEFGSSCDFRFATERVVIGLPEIPNLAVLPGSGGISRFTRLVGPHWARWLSMAGETVPADLALTMGWFHRILPEDGFHDAVRAWTLKLIGNSAEALGLAKLAIDAAVDADRRTARHFDRLANTGLIHTREHLDKIEAFKARSKR